MISVELIGNLPDILSLVMGGGEINCLSAALKVTEAD